MSNIRRIFLLICALGALSGSLVTFFGTHQQQRTQLRGYIDPIQDSALPFRIPRLGVNADLTQYSEQALEANLDLMQQAGIVWVRQFVHWDQIQPEAESWTWDEWDRIIGAVASRDSLKLVPVLYRTPAWARGEASDSAAPPADPADFGAFAQAFAERYGEAIEVYQIWDEPNLSISWGGEQPQPAQYLALLSSAYHAIRATDPHAVVMAAALAPTIETGPQTISDWQYLETLYQLGAADVMDAVAAKPYGFDFAPDDRTIHADTLNFSRLIGMREIMQKYDDGHTALWGSSWGWNSLPENWSGEPSIWGSVSKTQRTTYTLDALKRADREWPWLGGLILYHWQPAAPADDPVWGFALIDQDETPSLLYQALVSHTDQVGQQAASNGLYPAANPFTEYSGVWTFSDLGADIGWLKDSRFAFHFKGRDVGLLLREGDYVAHLYPLIDGSAEAVNALERDASGNPYILLTSPSRESENNLITVARNLTPGPHILSAVADEGRDQYALIGYAVSDGDLNEPYQRQFSFALLTTLISTAAVVIMAVKVDWRPVFSPLNRLWVQLSEVVQLGLTAAASVLLLIGMLLTFGREEPALLRREPVQLGLAVVTAGLLYLNVSVILSLISLLVLGFIFYHRPPLGLTAVIFFAPFFLFPVELYRFAFPMSELLVLLTAAAWLLRAAVDWAHTRHKHEYTAAVYWPRWNIMDFSIALWLVCGFAAIFWSSQRGLALTDFRTMFLEPALFYLIFRTTIRHQADFQRLFDILLISGVVVALVGLVLFARGEAIITAEGAVRRLASVYGSPNNVALFLGRCIPFAITFTLLARDRRRIFAVLALLLMIPAVILTQSVGGLFIGIPASIAVILILLYGKRAALPLLVVGVMAIAALLIGASLSPRIARVFTFDDGTNFIRLRLWQSSLNMVQDHPLTGLGLDQFLYAYRGHYILPDAWKEPDLSHPHNILLDYWLRLGISGVIVLIISQVAFWTLLGSRLHILRQHRDNDALLLAVGIGIAGSMGNTLAHGLIDNSIYVLDLIYVFMLLCAGAVYLAEFNHKDEPHPKS